MLKQLRNGDVSVGPCGDAASHRFGKLLSELQAEGWITNEEQNDSETGRLSRQIGYLTLFGANALSIQARIQASRVAIIGVGGIGSVVAQHLAGCGVGRMWLVDYDVVETHNLNRQFLFTLADVGKRKTTAAAGALSRLASELEIHTIDRRIVARQDLDNLPTDLDLLILAADGPEHIINLVWDWAVKTGVTICTAAVGLEAGYWGPILAPSLRHCWHCFERSRRRLLPAPDAAIEAENLRPAQYSFGPSNSVVAAMLSHAVIRFLGTGASSNLNRRTFFDFASGESTSLTGDACCCSKLLET
jgi:molybdopterin/thiamine biosynthesis adenylyltransferase